MKSVVYKYLIPFAEGFTLNLPKGSKVVRIDVENMGTIYAYSSVSKYRFRA